MQQIRTHLVDDGADGPDGEAWTGDPFEDFNLAMGAAGDFSPYPALAELRAAGGVHVGMPDMGIIDQDPDNPVFTAFSHEAVRAGFSDPATFSSAGHAEIMGPVLGRTILEMDPPDHGAYRSILQQAFTKVAMQRGRPISSSRSFTG